MALNAEQAIQWCKVKRPRYGKENVPDQVISGHIIPCNGDVAIPLRARLRSVSLFRLSLVGIRRTDGMIAGIRLWR